MLSASCLLRMLELLGRSVLRRSVGGAQRAAPIRGWGAACCAHTWLALAQPVGHASATCVRDAGGRMTKGGRPGERHGEW